MPYQSVTAIEVGLLRSESADLHAKRLGSRIGGFAVPSGRALCSCLRDFSGSQASPDDLESRRVGARIVRAQGYGRACVFVAETFSSGGMDDKGVSLPAIAGVDPADPVLSYADDQIRWYDANSRRSMALYFRLHTAQFISALLVRAVRVRLDSL